MNRKFYILFVCLICVAGTTFAQLHHFNKIPTRDGDANLSVRQVVQDNNGILWLATFSGLYRYQGDDFIIEHQFLKNEKINQDVNAIIQDNENQIWIGTNDGLSKYNLITEELVTYKHELDKPYSLRSNKIRSLLFDDQNRIWIGTSDGLNLYNAETDNFERVTVRTNTQKEAQYIRTIFQSSDGIIWLGTLERGLFSFRYAKNGVSEVQHFSREDENNPLSNNWVYRIFEDLDGSLAVCTRDGLNVFNSETKQFEDISSLTFESGSMTNYFRTVFRDKDAKLWIGTWDGLIRCDSFKDISSGNYELLLHNRNLSNSISHNQVMDVFQDKSGVIWVATENGLNNYDPYYNQFQPLFGEVIDNLSEQTATDFYPYNDGMLIMTLSDGIIYKKNNLVSSFYQHELPEFKNEKFYSIFVDSKNNVWAGSFNGLLGRKDAETGKVTIFKHSEKNTPIYSICEIDDRIVIGTGREGIKYFDQKTRGFIAETGLGGNLEVNDIHVDRKRRMWIATQQGIFKREHDDTKVEYFLPDNPDSVLSPNIFIDIAESASGDIVVGGRNGLYIFDEGSGSFESKSFNNDVRLWVTNLQFDSQQKLWLNLNFNKIACWDTKSNKLQTFNVNNGIRSSVFNRRGFYIDKDDKIYISGFDEIFEFDAAKTVQNSYSPKPVFTNLIINNTEVHTGDILNNQQILSQNISSTNKVVLDNQNKDFTIEFASASYLNTKANRYRYKLDGYDLDWNTGIKRSAHYTNLSPGKYSFEVMSANNDGVWSTESTQLQIKIRPLPLLSTWAFVVYAILMLVIVYFSRRIILARIQLRRELLIEKVKRDKEEKFHQERLRFYTNISHELRTPLTLIMGPTKELIAGDKPNSTNSKLHQLILNNSQRLLSLVNQLLDFRKSLHQGMKLKVTHTNFVELIESNIAAFVYMANEKNIKVDFKTSERKLPGWCDLEKLDIILFNILSNAFRYTPEYGFVTLELNLSEPNSKLAVKHVEIRITNTGKGIPKHLQEKVFERFYQIEENESETNVNTGTGIGLALVKNLVELHHGAITVESEPGISTTFSVLLPINKEDYKEEEIFDFSRDADRRTKELIKTVDARNEDSVYEKKDTERKKILIVEDNQELRDYLAGFLSSDYKVYTATDGFEGLERSKEKNPDLVISDVMMDNMDGLQFCKELKSTTEVSHIPVILMTALATVENKMEGYKIGADDYITKPFEPGLLKIRVKNILNNLNKIKADFGQNNALTSKELTISKIDEEFMNKVIDLIENNLDNANFDIDSFSKSLNLSSSQLYRKIKGIAGVSPNEFIRTYRLREAAKMINETTLTMSEIAYKVGFNDSLYFSKCFKKQFGIAPSKFGKM